MLSFLHRLDYSWKREFDTDVKKKKRKKIIIIMMKNIRFFKKVHIKTQSKKKDFFLIFIFQETKDSNLFDKNCTQENVKCHIQHEDS